MRTMLFTAVAALALSLPVAGNAVCHLYFMDTGEHCVKFTGEAEAARGIDSHRRAVPLHQHTNV